MNILDTPYFQTHASPQNWAARWAHISALTFLLLCLMGALPAVAESARPDFYVATDGNDSWSGTLARPNSSRTDGPFATLAHAQQILREHKPAHAVTVAVRGGTYFLKEPLRFTPQDSGTASAPITYTAYPGEHPVLSGGQRIAGWQARADGLYTTTLPDVASGKWQFTQLWVEGQRRLRPRLPKNGFYFIADSLPPSPKSTGKGYDQFKFTPGEIKADWSNLHDVEALCFQEWTMTRLPIEAVDPTTNIVTLIGNTQSLADYAGLRRGYRYLLENVKEALQEPGEWYLDRPTGTLTYLALPGEKIDDNRIIAPRLEQLLTLEGTETIPVQYVTFRGLAFAHTNWVTPPTGSGFGQAEVGVNAAIAATETHHCLFDHCTIERTGNYALELATGCKNNRIESCVLRDLGAGGIKLGDMRLWDQEARVASDNTVRNCLIAHGGRMHPAGIGVWIGQSPNNTIEHNTIADFYYTAVSVGWSWGYAPTRSHNNHIAANRILRIGQGVLSDMGGIYTLGLADGSVLEGNVISEVQSFSYGGWGIYLDEGTTNMLVRNNIVYDTKTGGFHQHYGKENRVTNNIFAYARQDGELIRTRAEDHRSFTMDHNIVIYRQSNLLGSNWSGNNYALDDNLYWNTAGKPVTFNGKTLAQWQQQGQDAHSQIADPLFIAPERADFRLKPGSPAKKLGFAPINISRVGPLPDPNRRRGEPDVPELAKQTVAALLRGAPDVPRTFPVPPSH